MIKKCLMFVLFALILGMFGGCNRNGSGSGMPGLDPGNPVTITIWHYYTGVVLSAFEGMINEFNESIGRDRGIIVEGFSFGSVGDLEAAARASANQEAGSLPLPNIFSSFPDTAYATKQLGLLSNMNNYFTAEQQAEYFPPFIDRGRIGNDGELHIFPVSKSTEVMFLNHTAWIPFAAAHGLSYDDLLTMEGVVRVAQIYYNYTGGLAFFGRDAIANMFIIGSKQFGTEIFEVHQGSAEININEEVMRRIWDYYYTPFISGYFAAFGRFRSDDVRVGDLMAYVGSTVSAVFFPTEVRVDGESHPIEARVLPAPLFEAGNPVMVQQGAGKVVTISTPEEQYASLIFLRWFTEPAQNLRFSALTSYMPVRIAAMDTDLIRAAAEEHDLNFNPIAAATLEIAIEAMQTSEIYATSSFTSGVEARSILTNTIRNKALNDRALVLEKIENGIPREYAIAYFASYDNFRSWVDGLRNELVTAAG